ncbi:uncharacterized protein zmp:0000000991 isoform X2 [Girardinichthys multiradiatus]|uniref:uncharacterized protein zmp:0000000991 isoform X2 n=1 Tax=Girardinichthys multiradiatus TaxID=208333 RepID=UPI001FAD48C3|nr:uncharacterized protein zmp:0000000991 isoform X2 [Girardinichthys multiradiatus]
MSTSDAAELELRVGGGGGGETETPQCAAASPAGTTTTSEHQGTSVGRFPHANQYCGKTAAEHHPPAFRQEENHEVLTSPAESLRKDKAYRWGHSEVQFEISADSIFITRVFLRLSKPKLRLENTLEPWLGQHPSLVELRSAETNHSTLQVAPITVPCWNSLSY